MSFLVPKSKLKKILFYVSNKIKKLSIYTFAKLKTKFIEIIKKYKEITTTIIMILCAICTLFLPLDKELNWYLFMLVLSIMILYIKSLVKVSFRLKFNFKNYLNSFLICLGSSSLVFALLSIFLYFNSWRLERLGLKILVGIIVWNITYSIYATYTVLGLSKILKQRKL